MREIKFRAWQKEVNLMVMVMSLTRSEQTPYTLIRRVMEESSIAIPSETLIFMEYTCIKDKNGKEIYEGDVLRRNNTYPTGRKNGHVYRFVKWSYKNGGFGSINNSGKYEIIGNIYENPELLTQ